MLKRARAAIQQVVKASMGRDGIACQYESEKQTRPDKAKTKTNRSKGSSVFDTKRLLHQLDGLCRHISLSLVQVRANANAVVDLSD